MSIRLTSPTEVRALLQRLDFRPSKVLGQNFLIDHNICASMVEAAAIESSDTVLEIGPGLGVLTERLLREAKQVVAVEKDDRLAAHLAEYFAGVDHLDLRHADATKVDWGTVAFDKMVSNLPYSVGNRILVDLIQSPRMPGRMVMMVQDDVALRLRADPGNKVYGALSIFVQTFYEVKKLRTVKPSCFIPPPSINSGVVLLERRPDFEGLVPDRVVFMTLLKRAFSQRRKKMGSIFREGLIDEVDGELRPEQIPPPIWALMAQKA
jgi:16S rRNA (adenine1518-N6/adenine1519-N6)-dimethyltransferase